MSLLAQNLKDIFGEVKPPEEVAKIGTGKEGIATLLSNIINIIYTGAAIVFVFMVIFSAWQWITSGGDKEKIEAARQRLTWAIIGIVILALTFVLLRVFGTITGFEFFGASNPCGPGYQLDESGNCVSERHIR